MTLQKISVVGNDANLQRRQRELLNTLVDGFNNSPTFAGTITISVTFTLPTLFADGDATSPGIAFAADTNTGIYRSGSDALSITTGGSLKATFGSTLLATSLSVESTGDHMSVANTDVYYELKETDGASNAKVWWWRHTGGNLFLQTRTDAGAAGNNALTITRSGTTVSQIQLGPDGVVGTPALSFENDSDTGFYRVSGNVLATAVGGQQGPVFQQNGGIGQLAAQDGIVGFPGMAFNSDADTGFFRAASGQVNYSSNGVSGILMTGAMTSFGDGYTSGDRIRLNNSTTRSSSNLEHYFSYQPTQLDIYSYDGSVTTLGSVRFRQAQVQLADGLVGTPVLSFNADTDTGLYRVGTNALGIATAGVNRVQIDSGAAYFRNPVATVDGSITTPGLFFESDTDTGIYRIGTDQIGIVEGGVGYRIGLRVVPRRTTTFATGECTALATGITLNTSDMAAGNTFTIYNDTGTGLTITQGSGVTLRLAGSSTTGNRTISLRGIATIWCNSGTEAIINGNVV